MSTLPSFEKNNLASPSQSETIPTPVDQNDLPQSVAPQTAVKLNLPPKPVLATKHLTNATTNGETIPVALQDPPHIPMKKLSSPLSSVPLSEDLSPAWDKKKSSKKKFSIGLPLAFILFLITLISLLLQLRFLF
jgi:hypothetical protein